MGIDTTSKKVQINKLVSSQVPSFVVEDNPLFVDFLKQYYISQEYQGGNIDIVTNLNDYQKVENFTENSSLVGFTTCTSDVNSYDATINVSSTEGWPDEYGLLKIDGEIITYTSKTETSFKGCVRGFCGVDSIKDTVNPENLVFSQSESVKHLNNTRVINLSNLFLQEFWKKTKNQFLPGFEDRKLHSKVDKANFLRQAKDFYSSKGTDEAIKILFGVLFDARAEVIKPIEYLFAPSDADYIKTDDLIVEVIAGNPENVVGQTLFQTDNTATSGSIFNVQYFPRNNRHYYIISLSKGSTVGTFTATGSSSLVNSVSIGASVLTVDSTLGFPDKGTVYVGAGLTVGIATYTNRSSTQFFGVTGISSSYTDSDFVRSTGTVYAYENGDVNKPVYFRLTNVVNGADVDDVGFLFAKDIIEPRQLGRVSDSANHNLNTWIHNIKTKSDVARDIQTATSKVDVGTSIITTDTPHLLRSDDTVTLLDISDAVAGNPSNVEGSVLQVYNDNEFRISITSGSLNTSKIYKVRRELNYAKSSNNLLGVSMFAADVQNTYTTRDNKTVYITTGSLPSYEIFANDRSKEFTSAEPGPADQPATSNVNHIDDLITINNHNFLSGQLVRYSPVNLNSESVVGLDTGSVYAVSKKNDNQLYLSRSVADAVAKKYISIIGIGTTTSHRLTPSDLADKNVNYQNFLRKFPITPEVKEVERSIENEPVGMFRNGVEIFSNKSGDSIHYGPIEHIDVESGGSDYDIISPPNINISDNVGTGATAYAVIEGGLKGIEVLSGGYDIKRVPNVAIVGGNGQGATASARLKAIRNSRLFDAKDNVTINTRAVITVTLSSGVINAASISNAGTGYIEPPTITIPDSLDGNGNVVGTGGELSTTVDPTGRVTSITVIDGGSGYSSAPTVTISSPEAGTTATGTAVLTGNTVSAINITNPGSGYTENPEVTIDVTSGGGGTAVVATSQITKGIVTGVSVVAGGSGYTSPPTIGVEQPPGEITFSSDHLFFDGESIVYEKSTLNPQIPGLVHKSVYYVDKINERRIRLMNKFEDAVNNTKAVILTAQSIGSHSITATDFRNVVDQIVVENEGSGYSNRKVEIESVRHPSINYYTRQDVRSGISTANNYMFHKMHGFNSGDLVEYKIAGIGSTAISGLSTNSSYHVSKLDEDKFRLSYAGVKGGRTNIVSNSEDIEGSVVFPTGNFNGNLTADVAVTTPDNGTTAYTLTGTGSNASTGIALKVSPATQETGSVGLKTDTHYVFSAFVKKAGHRYVKIHNASQINWVDPHGGITLDFDTGNTHAPNDATHASGVIPYPNGWYRLWWEDKTEPVGNGPEGTINKVAGWYISLPKNATGTNGNTNIATTNGSYIWGLQAEEITNYPTEYIPTSGLPRTVDTIGSVRDYHKGKFVDIGSNIGIGCTHVFKYPDIEVKLESTSGREVIEASSLPIIRPLMRGSIRDVFLTETGVGYGSTDTINGHRRPLVTISNGSKGLVDVDVSNGELSDAFVKISGEGYASPPELIVEGEGKYGKLISNVEDGQLTSVIIADKGKDYTKVPDTTVRIKPQGSGAVFRGDLREWRLTTVDRYKNSISQNDDGIILPSQHSEYGSKFVSAYLPRKLRLILDDNINTDLSEKTSLSHSPIVGWSYDGAPIYGPYGYTSSTGGIVRRLLPGYTANLKSNRPPTSVFPLGFFVEDYDYTASGDLDENNGRFGKTPEYPDGVYAYFCTISSEDGDGPFTASKKPVFPYILNGYHFKKEELNGKPLSLQTLPILNSGDIIRNTLPYKLGFLNADYDYLVSNNIEDTELSIQTIAKSGIGSVLVKEPGENYKIGDTVVFNNDYSGGRNAMARVRTLVGKGITEVSYTKTTINNITFDYRNANGNGIGIAATAHGLQNNDLVIVSGIGTGELKFLEGPKTIAVSSVTSKLGSELRRIGLTGDTEFIELVDVVGGRTKDDDIMVDDWLIIGENEEKVKVLEIDETLGRYKILRQTGIGQTWFDAGTRVSIDQSKFTFPAGIGTDLIIRRNATLTFDPQGTIGIGTVLVNLTTDNGLTAPTVRMKARNNEILEDHQLPPNIGQPGSNADNTISIPNHGLLTGQRLRYSKSPVGAALSVSPNVGLGNSFRLEDGSYVYAVKKSNDLLGITTTRVGVGTTSASLYICTIKDANKVAHSFRTTNEEHVGSIDKIDVGVYTVSEHTLKTNDDVTIDISSNATINKTIEYDAYSRSTIVDPYYIASNNISTSDSSFTLNNHVFEDGDKILYSHTTNPSNKVSTLTNGGEYYVKKISANKFRLFDNRKDAISVPSAHIKIIYAGSGVHRIVRINPPISVMRGETVGFAVSDSSNTGFILEFFKDEKFKNEFDGIGISTEIIRTGDPGTAGAMVNLKLTNDVPLPLWYKLTPTSLNTINDSKRDSYPDDNVINRSKISITPSTYAGNFGIKTTGITSFTYQVPVIPERTSYTQSGISTYRYVTDSENALGGINEIQVRFPGVDYQKNPGISSIRTTTGRDGFIRMYDDTLGRPGYKEVVKIGYDYPTDKSLSPRADTPVTVTVENNLVIGSIGIVTAGRNYSTAPDLFFPIRPTAKTKVHLEGTSIGSVEILEDSLTGFNEVPNPPRIIPINNTNGVGVVTARCFDNSGNPNQFPLIEIKRPLGGWRPADHDDGTNFPFAVGDDVYIENVNINEGDDPRVYAQGKVIGYNSDMYDYNTFKITQIDIGNSWFKYSLVGIGTWGGTFDPINSAGRVIKKGDLPTFNVTFEHRDFINGEPVTFGDGSATGEMLKNWGWDAATNSFRLRNLTRTPYVGDVVVGRLSKASGKVVKSVFKEKYFTLDHKADRVKGWQKDTGKLNNDFQRIPDNDYYQNFSYSIQSEVQEQNFKDALENIAHPTGYKNFSDLVIKSNATPGFARSTTLTARSPQSATDLKVNIDNIASMYVKNDYDFATEETFNTGGSSGGGTDLSKFISFQNRKITNLLSVSSAKVEIIDDISNEFDGKTGSFLGKHTFLRSDSSINGGAGITIVSGGSGSLTPAVQKYHSVSNAAYTASNGNMVLTLESGHGLLVGESVHIEKESLPFTCAMDGNSYIKNYPRSTDPQYNKFVDITAVSGNNITVNVGTSPIVNHNVTNATYNPNTGDMELTIGSHTLDIGESVKITTGSLIFQCTQDNNGSDHAYPRNTIDNHTAVDADYDPATGLIDIKTSAAHGMTVGDLVKLDDNSISFKCDYGNYPHTYVGGTVTNGVSVTGGSSFNVTDAYYTGNNGHLVLTIGTHSLTTSNTVTLTSGAFKFTCDSDGNTAIISYPRATDPAHNTAINIIAVDQAGGRITVNVGTKADDVKSYPRATDPISGKWKKVISTPSNDRFVIQVLNTIPSTNIDTHYFVSATNNGIKQKRDRSYDSAIPIKAVTSTKITLNVGKSSNTTTHRWKPSHTASNAIQSGGNYTHTWIGGTKTDSVTSGGTSYDPYTGKLTIVTTTAHGLNNGATISISDNSLIFACDRDNYTTEHAYPRTSDPASTSNAKLNNGVLAISNKSGSSFDVTITTPVLGGRVVGLSSFRLTSQNGGVPLFTKVFNPSDSTIMTINSDIFRINNHGFATGEKIQYDPGNYNYGNNRVSIAATNTYEASVGGATTNFLPSSLYVIKLDNNRFKVTGFSTSTAANTFVPTAVGTGTEHSFDAGNPENRVMIDIDGVIQSPLYNKSVSVVLANAVGLTSTSLKLKGAGGQAGITSIKSNDIINIGNELMRVNQVGIGSTNVVSVDRAIFGTTRESHLVSAACTMKAGHFNIVKDVLYFKTPPYGPTGEVGLTTQSSFHGRVFNRRDVANNFIFDDISHKFTGNAGTGRTFTLTENSSDVTGIVTTVGGSGGSDEVTNYGVILINGVFQRPKVDYEMTPRSISPHVGIGGSVSFTGETIESIPRGGKIGEVVPHSVLNNGFGGGYQPRVAAAATAVINAAGSVQSVTVTGNGSGYQSGPVTVEIQNPLGVGSAAVLTATVGTGANQGKITGITTVSGGTGYSSTVPPIVKVGIATGYTNLSFTGGTGSGFVVDVVVGAAGSIISYDVRNRGFGYKNGEVLTIAGIPTDVTAGAGYSSFEFKVKEVFDDEFSGYSFGQLVPLDDFSKEFNGVKKVFTLTKTDIVKEIVTILSLDTSVNATNNLLIFLNDVLQKPGENYSLTGGTTVNFVEAPRGGSKLQVLFFRGSNADIEALNPVKTIKVGDKIQILQGENLQSQTDRVVSEITDVSKVETPPYGGGGITTDTSLVRVSAWKKQESDLIVDGLPIAKDRPTLIGKFIPSANIIQSVGITSGTLYVDNAFPLFSAYDNRTDTDDIPGEVELLNVQDIKSAHGYSTISAGGKLTSITLNNGSVGYAMSDFLYVSDRKLGGGGAPDLVIKVDTISQGGSIVAFSEQSGFANNTKRVPGYYENVSTTVGFSTSTGKGIGAMFDISVDGNGKPTAIDIAGGRGYENAPTISISSKVPQTPEIGNGWTKVQSNTDVNYRAVDYTPQGVFVAVGSTSGIQTSTDGKNWTTSSKGSTETKYYHGVVGLSTSIVIVGAGGTIITSNNAGSSFGPTKLFNKILTGFQYDYSEYKITQTLNDAAVGKRIVPSISSTIPQEKVVVVGAGGTIIISEPGVSGVTTTFVVNSFHATQDFNGVDHNQIDDDSGTFVAVGNAGAIYRSTNGEQWTGRTTPAITTNLRSIAYGEDNTWIAVGAAGTVIKSTDDGLSWTVVNGGNIGVGNTISLHSVHYQKNVWVAVGTNGMALNSITGDTWYKKHIVNAGTPVGQIMYGLSYGDNKLVSVGMSSSIVWTGSEVRKATATSTIGAAGTVTGVTITDGGFGYDTSNPPNILFSQETVTREKLKSVNIRGDFGSIVGVGTSSNGIGAGTTSQRVIFELDSDPFLNQAAFGNIARSQLTVGDYFIVKGSRVGGAVTSVTKDGNVIGIGTTFADNVYRVEESITSTSGITTVHCNIESNIGIGSHSSALKLEFGYYSWGKLYDLTRGVTPKSYSINNDNGYVGLTTGPTVTRINPLAVTYSNFDQTS